MSPGDSMTDTRSSITEAEFAASKGSAGAMLRAARLQRGVHIAALAASMKVPPAKLEALEADRYEALPDTAFVRALALSVCRNLKIDPSAVLAQLPGHQPKGLERVDGGLNAPFRDRPGRIAMADLKPWRHPIVWLVTLLLVAAAAVAFTPTAWFKALTRFDVLRAEAPRADVAEQTATQGHARGSITEPAAASATLSTNAMSPAATMPGTSVAAHAIAAASSAAESARVSSPMLADSDAQALTRIRAVEATWVQVSDGNGQLLLSRLLQAGETVGFEKHLTLKLRIGNARGTEVSRHGKLVDLAAATRDNVAQLDLH